MQQVGFADNTDDDAIVGEDGTPLMCFSAMSAAMSRTGVSGLTVTTFRVMSLALSWSALAALARSSATFPAVGFGAGDRPSCVSYSHE
jgi:hypothetical protein